MGKKRVIIVGSGPAGLFAALELSKNSEIEILMFEKRARPGGAGTNSDGKLVLSSEVGGQMSEIIGDQQFNKLMGLVDRTFTQFGGAQKVFEKNTRRIKKLVEISASFDLRLIPTKTRHFGSDNAPIIVKNIKDELEKRGVRIYLNTPVESIEKKDGVFLVRTGGNNPEVFESQYVIVGTGRDRTGSSVELLRNHRLTSFKSIISDFGIRVEVPEYVFSPITDYIYDPKFVIEKTRCTGDRVRTFCVCPRGQVTIESEGGLTLVNGHSFEDESKKTKNTNFAILVSMPFTWPFEKPLEFGQAYSSLFNMLSGKVMVQRLGDLTAPQEKRSWPKDIDSIKDLVVPTLPTSTMEELKVATPGDLGCALPYRYMRSILEILERLNKVAPGVWSEHTLLYAPEVKFYSNRVETSKELETQIEGLFTVGDGAGITRGIMHASISGIVAAQAIIKRCRI